MPAPEIDLPVYPDECDAFGHLNQASFLTLFERARWEMLARGPGMNVFERAGRRAQGGDRLSRRRLSR
jgi:acyl-CoA thioesterase FadM